MPKTIHPSPNIDAIPQLATGLTGLQQLFVSAYLANGMNAARAAKEAGYKGSYRALCVRGCENLKLPKIRAAIAEALRDRLIAADEVLDRLVEQATATMEDFIDENGNISLTQAREHGKLHLLKRATRGPRGELSIELMDQQRALETVAKLLNMFAPARLELSGRDGGAIEIRAIDYHEAIAALAPDDVSGDE